MIERELYWPWAAATATPAEAAGIGALLLLVQLLLAGTFVDVFVAVVLRLLSRFGKTICTDDNFVTTATIVNKVDSVGIGTTAAVRYTRRLLPNVLLLVGIQKRRITGGIWAFVEHIFADRRRLRWWWWWWDSFTILPIATTTRCIVLLVFATLVAFVLLVLLVVVIFGMLHRCCCWCRSLFVVRSTFGRWFCCWWWCVVGPSLLLFALSLLLVTLLLLSLVGLTLSSHRSSVLLMGHLSKEIQENNQLQARYIAFGNIVCVSLWLR